MDLVEFSRRARHGPANLVKHRVKQHYESEYSDFYYIDHWLRPHIQASFHELWSKKIFTNHTRSGEIYQRCSFCGLLLSNYLTQHGFILCRTCFRLTATEEELKAHHRGDEARKKAAKLRKGLGLQKYLDSY